MKKYINTQMMIVFAAVSLLVIDAKAQDGRPANCCSNAYIYANVMAAQLREKCNAVEHPKSKEDLDRLILRKVREYSQKVVEHQNHGTSSNPRSCYGKNFRSVVTGIDGQQNEILIDPKLCFTPERLIPLYAASLSEGLVECGVMRFDVPLPANITLNMQGQLQCNCCQTGQCPGITVPPPPHTTTASQPCTPPPPPPPTGDDRTPPTKVDPPVPPQVPTEPMLSAGLTNAIRPSDTRMTSLQMPIVMDGGTAYASVGGRIKPYFLSLQDDWKKAQGKKQPILAIEGGLNFWRALWFSFGAAQGPKWNQEGSDTNKAIAIGWDLANELDPTLDAGMSKCIKDALATTQTKSSNDANKAEVDFIDLRDTCLNQARYATSLNFATANGVLLRPSYVFEFLLGRGASISAYSNAYLLNGRYVSGNKYFPIELGSQFSYGASIYSVFADGSGTVAFGDRPEFNDTIDHLRFSGGFGGSLALFNDMTATFGVRYVPSAWEDSGADSDVRLITSIGWAGNDAAAEYINNRWNAVLNEIQNKEKK